MVVIENIDRNYKLDLRHIESMEEGAFFEFKNELYIKAVHSSACMNISRGEECVLPGRTIVHKVTNCEIEYSLIKDKKEPTIIPEREYQKYEFCKAKSCSFLMSGGCSTTGCKYTAKEFHSWICANSFRIIKTSKKED